MKTLALFTSIALASAVGYGAASPQASATADWKSIVFHFSRGGEAPAKFTVSLDSAGKGFFWQGPPDYDVQEVPNGSLHAISVGESMLKVAAASLPSVRSGLCETKLKHLAQTGRKTIIIVTKDASPQCEFNYSDDERVNAAESAFQAIAETMQYGDRLQREHRYDRLGLDAEIDSLTSEAQAGRAIELQNIAPVLQSILEDDRVMERVRRKAGRLLQQAGVASAPDSSPR
jgi:hypothetical protein